MQKIVIKISNNEGIHLREATKIIDHFNLISKNTFLKKGNKKIKLNSVTSLLLLDISKNDIVTLYIRKKNLKKINLMEIFKNLEIKKG